MKLSDTLSNTKTEFTPLGDEVKMYVCGPNLYGPCHVGHALSFIVFDVLRRYLEYKGYNVRHVQNFTDIEDRIIELSNTEHKDIKDISDHYIDRFMQEMDQLGIKRAHFYPRATEYIPQMIEIVTGLINKDLAYEVDGDVYFRVQKFSGYGKLSKRSLEEMEAGARIEIDPRKDDPMDFAVWKASKRGEPAWDSPWGQGRPGWHIECSGMSLSLLGNQFDIHGGGHDVIFPHHENEIAQSEGYTSVEPVVRYWVHNGLLRLTETDDEKMTRHSGNFVSLEEALATHSADALRLFLLSAHYRSPRAYSEAELDAHERSLERIRSALREPGNPNGESMDLSTYRVHFDEVMDDDLNTPRAISVLFDLIREINRARTENKNIHEAQLLLRDLGGVLGLTFSESQGVDNQAAGPFVELLVNVRTELRTARQFALADSIRDRLTELGVTLEDSSQGTRWRF